MGNCGGSPEGPKVAKNTKTVQPTEGDAALVKANSNAVTAAVSSGNVGEVQRLLRLQGGVLGRAGYGSGHDTPAHLAVRQGAMDVVRAVAEAGGAMDKANKHGDSPLHLAAMAGDVTAIEYLVRECDADLLARGNNECTPLHNAVLGSHIDAVKLLLRLGASPNATDSAGNTPLHVAASHGLSEMVLKLEEAGADVSANNKDEMTPLDMAYANNEEATANILLRFNAPSYVASPCT